MDYCEYMKLGHSSPQIWGGCTRRVPLRFPGVHDVKSYLEIPLQNSNNLVVVGNCTNFKEFFYAEILKSFDPNIVKLTDIYADKENSPTTPLTVICSGVRGQYCFKRDINKLIAYLEHVHDTLVKVYTLDATSPENLEIIIMDEVLSEICKLDKTEVANEAINLMKDIVNVSMDTNARIVFIEDKFFLDTNTYDWLRGIVDISIPICFKCSADVSRSLLKTDIASILKAENEFYTVEDDGVQKYQIPCVGGDAFDNLLTNISKSR